MGRDVGLGGLRLSTLILFVTLIPTSMIFFACDVTVPGGGEPLDVVPAEAIAALQVDWPAICGDAGLRRMVSADDIEKELQGIGVGSSEVRALVYYSDGRNPGAGISGLVIVGPDAKGVTERLSEVGWSREETTVGVLLRSPLDGSCVAAVGGKMLALGTPPAIEAALRARRVPESRFRENPVVERLLETPGINDVPLRALIVMPMGLQDAGDALGDAVSAVLDLAGLGLVTDLVGTLGFSRGLQMTCSRGEGGYPSHVLAVMSDEGAARRIAGAFTLVQGIRKLVPSGVSGQGQGSADPSLQDMTVTPDGDVLSIRFTIPLDSL